MMPYVQQSSRNAIDGGGEPMNTGELAYELTKRVNRWISKVGASYNSYATAVGVLETVKLELYRRVISTYEDVKIKENGDVF